MNMPAYTSVDEDVFSAQSQHYQPRRRRSSMLNRWINDQHNHPVVAPGVIDITDNEPSLPISGTRCNAYLAYPDLERTTLHPDARDDVSTLNSYDLLQDDDIPLDIVDCGVPEIPSTPNNRRLRKPSKFIPAPSSFRSFHLSFRSSSPTASSASTATPRTPSRMSLFPRNSRPSTPQQQHNRSSSLSTLDVSGRSSSPQISSAGTSRWRPSVLGHFSSPSSTQSHVPSDVLYTPSRPSMSSNNTYTSATATTTDGEIHSTPHKLALVDSVRSHGPSPGGVFKSGNGTVSSLSLWSHPTASQPNLNVLPGPRVESAYMSSPELPKRNATRIPFAPKSKSRLVDSNVDDTDGDRDDMHAQAASYDPSRPHVAYSSANNRGTLPRVSFSSLSTRGQKKKLVISGIGPHDLRKFEGVKRWCESFGEVSQITRMPNGDLHVHFRRSDVADTVCRLHAKVYISGVGSVFLSWYKGNKR